MKIFKTKEKNKKKFIIILLALMLISIMVFINVANNRINPRTVSNFENTLAKEKVAFSSSGSSELLGATGTVNTSTYGKIHFISVTKQINHNADAILLESLGKFCLIDAGNPPSLTTNGQTYDYANEDGQKVATYIKNLGVSKLDCIIATHNHTDHIGGMEQIVNNNLVDSNTKFYYRVFEENNDTYKVDNKTYYNKTIAAMTNKNAQLIDVTDREINFNIGNFNIKLLNTESWTNKGNTGINPRENNNSIVEYITIGSKKVLLTADIEAIDEERLINTTDANKRIGKVDLLKLGHHGGSTSSSIDFLKTTQPNGVVVTGSSNYYPVERNGAAVKYLLDHYVNAVYYTSKVEDAIIAEFNSTGYTLKNADGVTSISKAAGIQKEIKSNAWTKITQENDSNRYSWYVFNDDGTPKTGIYNSDGHYYYLKGNAGNMMTGWLKVSGHWYYFNNKNSGLSFIEGESVSGFLTENGNTLVAANTTPGETYYLNPNSNPKGRMITGFYKINNNWYYFSETANSSLNLKQGQLLKGKSININGTTYTANSTGVITNYVENPQTDISSATITVEDQIYTGAELTPDPVVKVGATTLINRTDYIVNYSNNINAGTATVIITGKGNYIGNKTINFSIAKRTLMVRADEKSKKYKENNPELTYSYSGNVQGQIPSFTGSLETTATKESDAGTYDINQGTLTVTNGTNFLIDNYNVSFTRGSFTITKLDGALELSENNIEIIVNTTKTIQYTSTGEITFIPTSENIVSTKTTNGNIEITGVAVGETTITATSVATNNYEQVSKTINVKVLSDATNKDETNSQNNNQTNSNRDTNNANNEPNKETNTNNVNRNSKTNNINTVNNSDSNNANNQINKNNSKQDDTIATKDIPQTGVSPALPIGITALVSFAGFAFIKSFRMRHIN